MSGCDTGTVVAESVLYDLKVRCSHFVYIVNKVFETVLIRNIRYTSYPYDDGERIHNVIYLYTQSIQI